MGMGLGTNIGGLVPMDIEVGDHAARDELPCNKIARQCDTVSLIHLARNRKLDIAGKLRVLANLARLDCIPKRLTVRQSFWRTFGQQDLRMNDTRLVGEVMVAAKPLVGQPFGSAIGSRRNRARTVSATDNFGGEMVDRHDTQKCLTFKRRWQQRISAHSKLSSPFLA
jgi:hypothetical protein